ncbi:MULTISPECIES: hypothetical protein [Pseudomonas]|uniref:Site-specific integrase n=1 Tax=Pseudomonas mosselii TaxID=78327 RepID=A0A5R8YZN6_9PSED|nr:hypothetical protein [Pseudomonas mosselii]TLP59008.1 hypothetical protein FEM01_13950 [Pseudomonas mosselii]
MIPSHNLIATTEAVQPTQPKYNPFINTNNTVFINYHDESIEVVGVGHAPAMAIYENLSAEAFSGFSQTLTKMCTRFKFSPSVIWASISDLNKLLTNFPCPRITEDFVHSFQSYAHYAHCNFFHSIKRILTQWHDLALPGVDPEAIELLRLLHPPAPPRPAGSKVQSDDPNEGWYTNEEHDLLIRTLWQDLEKGITPLDKSTLCLLSAQYGRRPVQFARLKIKDLQELGETQGVKGRRIAFPAAKERAVAFRQGAPEVHPIADELWDLCQQVAKRTIAELTALTGIYFTKEQELELPLFSYGNLRRRVAMVKKYERTLDFIYASRLLHCLGSSTTQAIRREGFGTKITSERTGEILLENAYRNRYTRTWQLARAGVPMAQLQFWLGHKTSRALHVYYKDDAETARMLRPIAPYMNPIVRAFTGPIRDEVQDRTYGNEGKISRISLNGRESTNLGGCGERTFCAAGIPVACYHCPHFEPWLDGPHHQVLDMLIEKEKRHNLIPTVGSGRNVLMTIDYEREKEAVIEVIRRCEMRKLMLEDQKNG